MISVPLPDDPLMYFPLYPVIAFTFIVVAGSLINSVSSADGFWINAPLYFAVNTALLYADPTAAGVSLTNLNAANAVAVSPPIVAAVVSLSLGGDVCILPTALVVYLAA